MQTDNKKTTKVQKKRWHRYGTDKWNLSVPVMAQISGIYWWQKKLAFRK